MLPSQTPKTVPPLSPVLLHSSAQSNLPDLDSEELHRQYFGERDDGSKDKNNKSILKGFLSGVISPWKPPNREACVNSQALGSCTNAHNACFQRGHSLLLREFLPFHNPQPGDHKKETQIHRLRFLKEKTNTQPKHKHTPTFIGWTTSRLFFY